MEFMDSSDTSISVVRFSVQCPELDFPITIPFVKVSQMNADRLLSEIERVLQSYEQFVLDESLDIEIVHVSLMSVGVGKRCNVVDLDKLIQIKKCFIRIKNADDLCCARVIVTAKARLEENAKWESIRHGGNLQTVLAENLHKEADVPLQRCGISEIKRFQDVLTGYQINVISKDHFNGIIFSGPEAENQLYVYHHDNHYDVITSMPAFFSRNYFCVKCKLGYDHKTRHRCNNPCICCHYVHEEGTEDWKSCSDCRRSFRNVICYELHNTMTIEGNSTCRTYYKCKQCDQTINTRLHKKPHHCKEQYCKACKDFFDEDHQCYMQTMETKQTEKYHQDKKR